MHYWKWPLLKRKAWPTHLKKRATNRNYSILELHLTDINFRTVIINMFKKIKEAMFKPSMKTRTDRIENTNKETEIIKENQMEILELRSLITKVKNSLDGLKSRTENWLKEE